MINSSFDTETVNGNIVVIAFGDGTFIEFPTLDEILVKLTSDRKMNRFLLWNLRFDSEGFLKMLPYENIVELMNDNDTIYKQWKLHVLGASNIVIRDIDETWRTSVYDLAQFFKYIKLGKAAKDFLPGKEFKLDSEVISTFVDSEHGQNTVEYYKKHRDEINRYCVQDAHITRLLADYFESECAREDYDFRKPYSLGNLAIKWFRPYLKNPDYKYGEIPRIHPIFWKNENIERRVIENIMGDLSRGGWNDSLMRGKFDIAYDYDIEVNS